MSPSLGNQPLAEHPKPLRAIVTGATGFIGRYVVQRALARGWNVLAVGRGACPWPLPPGLQYAQCNGSDAPALPGDWIGRPLALVHLAWDTARTPRFSVHLRQAQRLAELVETLQALGLSKVIGLGSADEFGSVGGTIQANHPPQGPLSPYGLGKRVASDLLANWSARAGVSVKWLCPMLVYGPGQSGNMVLPYALRHAMRGERAEFSDGKQQRDLVYVEDVATAIVTAVESDSAGFQRLMLGTGQAVPVREAILEVARQFDCEARFELGAIPRRPDEPALQQADIEAVRTTLGWQAAVDWRTGIARLCQSTHDDRVRAALMGQVGAVRTWLPHVPQPTPGEGVVPTWRLPLVTPASLAPLPYLK